MGRWDPRPVSERCSLRSPAPGGRTSAHQELEVSGEGGWRGPGEGWQGSRVQSIPLPLAERYLSLTLSRLSPLQHYDELSPGHLFSRSFHHVCLFGHLITCEKKIPKLTLYGQLPSWRYCQLTDLWKCTQRGRKINFCRVYSLTLRGTGSFRSLQIIDNISTEDKGPQGF